MQYDRLQRGVEDVSAYDVLSTRILTELLFNTDEVLFITLFLLNFSVPSLYASVKP